MLSSRSVLLLALLYGCSSTFAKAKADTLSNWKGGSGNWSDAGQWTPALVPNNTNKQSFDVSIGSGTSTLDISPTINTFTLNGSLAEGVDSSGNFTTLTVNGNATVNGSIGANASNDGWRDSLNVGGNLTNNGGMEMAGQLSVSGDANNSGNLVINASGPYQGMAVNGTLRNSGNLQLGLSTQFAGYASVTRLVSTGSVNVGPLSRLAVGSALVDIPKNASWLVFGEVDGSISSLTNEGRLDIEGTVDQLGNVVSFNLGSPGHTISNSATFLIAASQGASVVNAAGNLSNTGDIEVAVSDSNSSHIQYGTSTLKVAGTLTNQPGGLMNINNGAQQQFAYATVGAFNSQNLDNYGTANFRAGTTSTVAHLTNYGTLNIFGDAVGDVGKLTVNTFTTAGGVITVWNNGGTLIVGSGAVPAAFSGYDQFGNGVLNFAGGALNVEGPALLDGTLDVMLGDGAKPVGQVFTVLTSGPLSGTFSNVQGLVFDNGFERYLLAYNAGEVTLTVENNSTPEPAPVTLLAVGFAGLLALAKVKNRKFRTS